MSTSESDSSDSSSDCTTGWPWPSQCNHIESDSDEFDSSSEDSSDESSVEETTIDSWTNRRNIFISVYKTNNYKDITLITNYNELHNYRDKYTKLSKKSTENIKNIWSEVKVNIPELGIIPLKSYEKELIEDPKTKNKIAKKPTIVSEKTLTTDKTISPISTKNQSLKGTQLTAKVINAAQTKTGMTQVNASNVANKNLKEKHTNGTIIKNKENSLDVKMKSKENISNQKKTVETPTKTVKSMDVNKTVPLSPVTKVEKQDKGVKVDIVIHNVTKSESDKKNIKIQSTNSILQLGNDKNVKNNSNGQEFKKPQAKSDLKKNKTCKNNVKDTISVTKSKKQKQKNSHSQSSENSDTQKRSNSVDSHKKIKGKSKKKIEESDNDTTDNDDEDEEIIDNMDALTGNSEAMNEEKFRLAKHKDKPLETLKVAEKKINEKYNNEQNTVVTAVKNDVSSLTSEKNYVFYSEKFAEESVDMIMDNNLTKALDCIEEAMQYNPGDDRHYLNRCYCYLLMNKPSLALADATYVLQTSSHYGHRFIAYLRAGKASMELQKYTQAENYFKDSLSINSDNMYAQREFMRAKIARIASLGYTEKNAILALLKYSKTQEAISYLANKNIANKKDNLDNNERHFDNIENLDDIVYSSDEDEKPNCISLINNMLNYEPIATKLCHLLAKPVNMTTSLPPSKNANADKKKNIANGKTTTGQLMDKSIWVGSLPKNITEAALKKKFKLFGNVVSVYCPPNESYAFVNFEKSEHVTNILNNPSIHEINGHKLVIRQGIQKK